MVAIIAVLIAIAIPVFSAQLDSSRKAVDQANARSAESLAVADYLLNKRYEVAAGADSTVTYYFVMDDKSNLSIKTETNGALSATAPTGDDIFAKSSKCKGTALTITVKDGEVITNNWLTALNTP